MQTFKFTKYVCVSALLLLIGSTAHARTLSVNCGANAGLSSIGAALKALKQSEESNGANTINVSGACYENILIQNIDGLTLKAVNGAAIIDASSGTREVIDVANSHGFTLNGFTITTTCASGCTFPDAISCYDGADCLLIENTITGASGGAGVGVYALSKVRIVGGTLQNNGIGLFLSDSGEMLALGVNIRSNGQGAVLIRGASLLIRAAEGNLTPSVIANNQAQGIDANDGSTVTVAGPSSITNNGAEGVHLDLGSKLVLATFYGTVTITGNSGPGVSLGDLSVARFTRNNGATANVTGNAQPDVACNADTAVTHGVLTNIGGGHTNCPEGAPTSANVLLTSAHISGGQGSSFLRAFILTDSADPRCFVTFNESNSAGAGQTAYCGARAPSLYGGRPGVMLTVDFPVPVPGNVALSLNVHQNGAKQYGPPVACTPADGC
jgi:hypothetical protein